MLSFSPIRVCDLLKDGPTKLHHTVCHSKEPSFLKKHCINTGKMLKIAILL